MHGFEVSIINLLNKTRATGPWSKKEKDFAI